MMKQLNLPLSFISNSPEDTKEFAKEIAKQISSGDVLCLDGDLGAGKTTFSKAFISTLAKCSEDEVQSPTFIYLNIYSSELCKICHFDLYRIESDTSFEELGFLDYFDKDHICLVEWPSKLKNHIPKNSYLLEITYLGETKRQLTFKKVQ
jgi:tRNA threonylcarbamoyladenosine biosynthesis protein TsaE